MLIKVLVAMLQNISSRCMQNLWRTLEGYSQQSDLGHSRGAPYSRTIVNWIIFKLLAESNLQCQNKFHKHFYNTLKDWQVVLLPPVYINSTLRSYLKINYENCHLKVKINGIYSVSSQHLCYRLILKCIKQQQTGRYIFTKIFIDVFWKKSQNAYQFNVLIQSSVRYT